ncbi:hypothetical protein AVHY2522_18270 [Acidovorax sp. SUPP2522]|uniref:hypothetical protein n=2 Tax=unclassified Acidovorax TaxID=2684926 RepID=UPI0023DE56B3|nr:hypothetical protein [Acidovorax sp. SUPP2522]WCM99604.1 hypothetical protein M5C96_09465 [Acidovorax sp. GBBC 1281]GKT18297.1 hypothetical protein AVHY2522_18270 [Acidovorax sp. SUPP2522]
MKQADIPYFDALTPEQIGRVQTLVDEGLTLEQRWLLYGELYGAGAAGGDPLTRVKDAVLDRLSELQAHLCSDAGLLKVAASPATGVALSLAFAVTGKLVSAKFQDVDVVQLGVLIAQAGLFAICSGKL